ncbi:PREDICTED: uncharacterized protein LOC108761267 [Trachymyrmex cornetzi]|uniref:uncharacterized protein LOC108761267 n=1 Tax=Trachymyrmex cornetzi TaxID=471704 RepID=UPI00084F642A|nr:PREDICTED: uncharacterized protein LOC108761267 [Trachymyrmex cornetzi]
MPNSYLGPRGRARDYTGLAPTKTPPENINNKTSDKSTNIEEHLEATSSIFNVTPVSLEHALAEIEILQELQNKDTEIIQLQEKLDNVNKIFRTVDRSNKTLTKHIRKLRSMKTIRIEKSLLQSRKLLKKVFNDDQIEWLQSQCSKRRVYTWSEQTIKKALRIKFSCTNSGYQELIKQNIPLPSTRILKQSLEGIHFTPGILGDIFDAMESKVQQFEDQRQHDCMIGLDEMSLTPGEQFDLSTNSIVGNCTIPNSRGNYTVCSNV